MDMLQWFMDYAYADPVRFSSKELATRVLVMNFASIHTTANTFTHALYTLAAHPECVEPLREEVDAVVATHGWTKASISKLDRVDSFLRESIRINTLNGCMLPEIIFRPSLRLMKSSCDHPHCP
jgi:cytochrome P450